MAKISGLAEQVMSFLEGKGTLKEKITALYQARQALIIRRREESISQLPFKVGQRIFNKRHPNRFGIIMRIYTNRNGEVFAYLVGRDELGYPIRISKNQAELQHELHELKYGGKK